MIQYRLRIGDTVKIPGVMTFDADIASQANSPATEISARLRSASGGITYNLAVNGVSSEIQPDGSVEKLLEITASYLDTSSWLAGSYDLTVSVAIDGANYTTDSVSVAVFEE